MAGSVERPGSNSPGAASARRQRRQLLDVEHDQFGGILGEIGIVGKHRRDRLADIAHAFRRQHALAIGLEPVDRGSGGNRSAECRRHRRRSTPRARPAAPAPRSGRSMRMRPCAIGERTTRMCSWCGNEISAAKRPRPVSSGRSSSRGPTGRSKRSAQRRADSLPDLPHVPCRRGAHRLDDVLVAGAAAQIGREHVDAARRR